MPDEKTLDLGSEKLAAFIEGMRRYGFYPDLDTAEARKSFAREKLAMLPDLFVRELIESNLREPTPQVRVSLLEMDPANVFTLEMGIRTERLVRELAGLTRGILTIPLECKVEPTRFGFLHEGTEIEVPAGSPIDVVEGLNRYSERWGGTFVLFESEGEPIGVGFFRPEFLRAVRDEGFNPYR